MYKLDTSLLKIEISKPGVYMMGLDSATGKTYMKNLVEKLHLDDKIACFRVESETLNFVMNGDVLDREVIVFDNVDFFSYEVRRKVFDYCENNKVNKYIFIDNKTTPLVVAGYKFSRLSLTEGGVLEVYDYDTIRRQRENAIK